MSVTEPGAQGNYGFEDQRQAFRWTQENIAAFGCVASAAPVCMAAPDGHAALAAATRTASPSGAKAPEPFRSPCTCSPPRARACSTRAWCGRPSPPCVAHAPSFCCLRCSSCCFCCCLGSDAVPAHAQLESEPFGIPLRTPHDMHVLEAQFADYAGACVCPQTTHPSIFSP